MLLVGGGDSAFDWAVNLQGIAQSIMLIHRRDGFRAHQATINQVQEFQRAGKVRPADLLGGEGAPRQRQGRAGDHLQQQDEGGGDASRWTPSSRCSGFHSDLGAIKEWGLDTEKADIKVDQVMATNVPGIYAAGDITSYPGKLKLIATGAAEACIAVNNAVHWINPKAKVNPGHSSNLAIFGQSE